MRDVISRKEAIDAICEHGTELERRGITVLSVANHKQATVDLLWNLPSAERRGRWEKIELSAPSGDYVMFQCSECASLYYEPSSYCPNCGEKMEHSFHVGQYVLYHNKDKYELGRIVSLKQNCAFICYNEGETAAATSYDSIYPIENEHTIKTTTLGGDRFTEEEDN